MHIVAFNNPYPPNFGGAIDMFYKVKGLFELGVKVHLHVYHHQRKDVSGIDPYCETLTQYRQNRSILKHLSILPFSVVSRSDKILYSNLIKIEAPILFESLRTCYLLKSKVWHQKVAVRCHNIEHDYSWGLSKSETNSIRKLAHFIEGYKQRRFETVLNHADVLFPISHFEQQYYLSNFKPQSVFLPVFQGYNHITSLEGNGTYALYHGDLSSPDNVKSALFLIDVFRELDKPLVIASSVKVNSIISLIEQHKNMSFQYVDTAEALEELIKNAHINTLYSFQRSGTKLKVFTALYNGRHCIVNRNMIDDPDVLGICTVAETKEDYKKAVLGLMNTPFVLTPSRQQVLKRYHYKTNAQKVVDALF